MEISLSSLSLNKSIVPISSSALIPTFILHYGAWNDAAEWRDDGTWHDLFTPDLIFYDSTEGAWYDGTYSHGLYQDVDRQIVVASDGDQVAVIRDRSGRGHDAVQVVSNRRALWQTNITPNAVHIQSNNITLGGHDSRFPIPTLPNRNYRVWMSLKLGSSSQNNSGFRGLFATHFFGAGQGVMLLLKSNNNSNFGTYGAGGYHPSTIDIVSQDQPWSLVSMTDGVFRYNGAEAGNYPDSDGQSAGIGGVGNQLTDLYLGDLILIDRALTSVETTLLERYMAGKVGITLQ